MLLNSYHKIKHVCVQAIIQPDHLQYLKVFSHPRSGTHFLEAFIGRNFYKDIDLSVQSHQWGHWANREDNAKGNPYGKLFGSHIYPGRFLRKITYPSIYIYRDGRAVAASLWKTRNFIHPRYQGISFSEFLRLKIDWLGAPSVRWESSMNIAQHWENHVLGWKRIAESNENIVIVNFEEIKLNPYQVYRNIFLKFFQEQSVLLKESEVDYVEDPVGLLPNKAEREAWREIFTEEDIAYFNSSLKIDIYADA